MTLRLACLLSLVAIAINNVLTQTVAHGTTVVIIRNRDSIIVGAESKIRTEKQTFGVVTSVTEANMEKIREAGEVHFVMAGFYTDDSGFDAYRIAAQSLSAEDNIFQKAAKLRLDIRAPLEAAWTQIQRKDLLTDLSKRPLVFAVFGFYDDIPFVFLSSYRAKRSPSYIGLLTRYVPESQISFERYPFLTALDSTYCAMASDVINRQILADIEDLITSDPIQYVRLAIQRAIDRDPNVNGGPIRILCITRNGSGWIQ